jgi:hypothetical protein
MTWTINIDLLPNKKESDMCRCRTGGKKEARANYTSELTMWHEST